MTTTEVPGRKPSRGTFADGIPYVTWGNGPKTLLYISGEEAPAGLMLRSFRWLLAPYVEAGYTVWFVGRRHPMPPHHTVADMAEDYAGVIRSEFGGRVDLLVGVSTGGMIGQYLAADHPETFGAIALVVAAAEMTDVGKDVNLRSAQAAARGDLGGAGTALAEVLARGERLRWLRGLVGPVMGRIMLAELASEDSVTVARAVNACDSRAILPRIRVPVLLLCTDSDFFFDLGVIQETAGLIPHCTLVLYRGASHPRIAFGSRRVARDVLALATRPGVAA